MNTFQEILAKINLWISQHWRMVMATLAMIILMQQCTISRLRWEVEHITRQPIMLPSSQNSAVDSLAQSNQQLLIQGTQPTDSLSIAIGQSTIADNEVNWMPIIIAIIVVLSIASIVIWKLKNRGVYPFAYFPNGKLKQNQSGQLLYTLKLKNRSRSELNIDNVTINFRKSGEVRVFRASVNQLPLSLQPNTSFDTTINLTNLILREPDLLKTMSISVSINCNGVKRTTLPRFVRFQQK